LVLARVAQGLLQLALHRGMGPVLHLPVLLAAAAITLSDIKLKRDDPVKIMRSIAR